MKYDGFACAAANLSVVEVMILHVFAVGVADVRFLATVTIACAKRTGAAASVERMRRETAKAISHE